VQAAGIVHGDMRSENILVVDAPEEDPTVLLLD
jgi:RIO-like serine/threonine protein kinase